MTTLRLVAKLQEPRIWTYLQFLKVHRSTFRQTGLTFRRERGEKRGALVEERRDMSEEVTVSFT